MRPTGRIAVVTGASSGIGAAVARRLATDGMTVVAVARRRERLDRMAAEHTRILAHAADVADRAAVDGLANRVREELGRCDLLVNGAGVPGGAFTGPDGVDGLARTMQVNFMGAVHTIAAFRDLLVHSAPSQVINVASVSGKVGVGPPDYVASKFALVGLSESLSLAWARDGVTVTQLNPGFIVTEGFPQRRLVDSPVARFIGAPDDVADAVADIVERRPRERTVPRWYRPVVTVRHALPPVFWRLASRTHRARGRRDT
jgi:NAD(P)-dependent dehydrogenase (short-subunit alcohol dehydrogenase family)